MLHVSRFTQLCDGVSAKLSEGLISIPASHLNHLVEGLRIATEDDRVEEHFKDAILQLLLSLPVKSKEWLDPGFAALRLDGRRHPSPTYRAYLQKSSLNVEASPQAMDQLFEAVAFLLRTIYTGTTTSSTDALFALLAALGSNRVHLRCLKRLFPRLQSVNSLNLRALDGPPQHELDYVFSAMSEEGLMRLKHVTINSSRVPNTLHNLQVLRNLVSLSWLKALHDNPWANIFGSLPALKTLALEVVPPEQEPDAFKREHLQTLTAVLAGMPALAQLDLSLRIRYRGSLCCLSKLSHVLAHLRVFWSATWTSDDAEVIAALPVTVHVEANSLESAASYTFANMTNMTSLVYTGYMYDWSGAWTHKPKLDMDVLTDLPALKSLYAASLLLRNAASVSRLTTLTCLELEENDTSGEQDVGYSNLCELTALERLKLSKREHSADPTSWVPLSTLSSLTKLSSLSLVEIPAADADFSFLAFLPRLSEVTLKNTNFDLWALAEEVPLAVLTPSRRTLTSLQLTQSLSWQPAAMRMRAPEDLHLPKGCMPLNAICGLANLTRLTRLVLQGLPHIAAPAAGDLAVRSLEPLAALETLELTGTPPPGTDKGLPVSCLQRLLTTAYRAQHPFLGSVLLDPYPGTSLAEWQQLAKDTHPLIRVRWADAHLRLAVRDAHNAFEQHHTPRYRQCVG